MAGVIRLTPCDAQPILHGRPDGACAGTQILCERALCECRSEVEAAHEMRLARACLPYRPLAPPGVLHLVLLTPRGQRDVDHARGGVQAQSVAAAAECFATRWCQTLWGLTPF